jgi:peptidoglycan-N-acetylglucosamine deacetylase
MLTFKRTTLIFVLLQVFLILLHRRFGLPVYSYFILLFLYCFLLFMGSYRVDSGFYIRVICSAAKDKKEIAISFDDGPATEFTPQILQILDDMKVQAAFFCIGNRIEGMEPLFKRIHEKGHVLGNHSYSHHPLFDLFSAGKVLADLRRMDDCMRNLVGVRPKMFRPPYGVTNPPVSKAIRKGNYIPIGWSIRSLDTVIHDEKKLLRRITRSLAPGAIVLFHDTSRTTLAILPEFIRHARSQGYQIVRLDKLLKLEPYG